MSAPAPAEIDRDILSNSTWVADCIHCIYRLGYGPEVEAYQYARAHVGLHPKHRVLVYAATMFFKREGA